MFPHGSRQKKLLTDQEDNRIRKEEVLGTFEENKQRDLLLRGAKWGGVKT